jgi:hypothetical protein
MSRFKVEQLCFALTKKENVERFKGNPDLFIAEYPLTNTEKIAVKTCDLGMLYNMGVLTQAISALSRVFGNSNATYVQKLREAAGLPENRDQLEILKNRGR